jgi:DNA uptake protein ComE-like DNA-binding protein
MEYHLPVSSSQKEREMLTRKKSSFVLNALACGLLLIGCASPMATPATVSALGTLPATSVPATSAPAVVEPTAPSSPATEAPQPTGSPALATAAPDVSPVIKLNLNTATGDEFMAGVPGMSNRMVREFMEYRPYVSIQQFRREIGKYVDQTQVTEYEKYVYVPIDINNSDAATLQQISSLDATEAESLIAKRPFASNEAFLAELAQLVSEIELAQASGYLTAP